MKNKLFLASCISLTVTSLTFAYRAMLDPVFKDVYHLTNSEISIAFAPAFWGFTISMIIGGLLIKSFGAKRFINIMLVFHVLGIVITLFADNFITLFVGTLFVGIGNGFVEAVCNPLIAATYPDQKVKMLNRFHLWFPMGILIGSLASELLFKQLGVPWQVIFGSLLILVAVYGMLFRNITISEEQISGMGDDVKGMIKAIKKPLFLFMLVCMLFTAATELGTGQRIESLLKETGVSPLLVLAFIFGLMSLGRYHAGTLLKKLNTQTILLLSAVFSCVGLLALSTFSGYSTFAAAAIFAVGVCYFWPTMLGFVAEELPETGSLGLSLMGGFGMLSVSTVLVGMGNLMDDNTTGQETLRIMSILPAAMIIAFIILNLWMKKRKTAIK